MNLTLKIFLRHHKPALLAYFFVAVINSAAAFLLPVSIGEFFRIAFQTQGSKGKLLQLLGIHMETMDVFLVFFISLVLARALAEFFEKYLAARQGEMLVKWLRDRLFETQLHWDREKFRSKHFGNYLLRYSNDMKAVQGYLSRGWLGGGRELVFLMMGFSVLFIINRPLALLYESVFLFLIVLLFILSRRQGALIVDSRSKRSGLLAFVTRSFQRHGKISEEGKTEKVFENYEGRSSALFQSNMINHRFESFFQSMLPLFQYIMIGAILMAMAIPEMFPVSAGQALVFVLIMLQMNGSLKRLLKALPALNKGKISMKKISEILSDAPAKSN
jgi:hypothetical protein